MQITGYSSTQGDHATNALFAVERAQNVLSYLRDKGLQYSKVNATRRRRHRGSSAPSSPPTGVS